MSFDRTGIRLAAFALAMSAKTGELDVADVEALQTRGAQVLEHDDPLYRAICAFAVGYELQHYDRAGLCALGEDLRRAVEVDAMPTPPDADRRDIYG